MPTFYAYVMFLFVFFSDAIFSICPRILWRRLVQQLATAATATIGQKNEGEVRSLSTHVGLNATVWNNKNLTCVPWQRCAVQLALIEHNQSLVFVQLSASL